jgi:hypothetical protein
VASSHPMAELAMLSETVSNKLDWAQFTAHRSLPWIGLGRSHEAIAEVTFAVDRVVA